jgi:hypothetical protein
MSSSDARAASFAFGEAEARAAALAWIHRRWAASPALSRHAREGPIASIWIPFWLIDAHGVAHWEAPALRGIVEMDFGALPVCAEAGADTLLMEALEPWPQSAVRVLDPRDATARAVAPASLSRDDAMAAARRRMERELLATARRNQPAATRDRLRMLGVEYPREVCESVLLPIWRFDDVRFGRRWRIVVNGVTGKTAGAPAGMLR